jgi:ketosteroid isomerase-like protein
MSQENLALVRWALDAFNRRDLDGYLETIANDFVLWAKSADLGRTGAHPGAGARPCVRSRLCAAVASSRLRRAATARLTRRFGEAFNRRDFDVVLPFLHPDVEFEGAKTLVGGYLFPDLPAVLHGREGYRRMFEAVIEVWEDLAYRPEEVLDLG